MGTAATAAFLLLFCVRGTYFLTKFEPNCSNDLDSEFPCLKASNPAFATYPIRAAIIAGFLWLILWSIPARFVITRRSIATLVVLGPVFSLLFACETASGYGLVP